MNEMKKVYDLLYENGACKYNVYYGPWTGGWERNNAFWNLLYWETNNNTFNMKLPKTTSTYLKVILHGFLTF